MPLPATSQLQSPAPVEEKDAVHLKDEQTYFQTRDTISFAIDKAVIDGAAKFEVLNVTDAGGDDSKAIVVIPPTDVFYGEHTGGFGLADTSDDKATITLYPSQPQWQGKFFYAGHDPANKKTNKLKVVALDDMNPRYSYVELTLDDFDVFGLAMTSFVTNTQVASGDGFQFQGWLSVLSTPSVTTDDGSSTLTNGIFNIVNPR